MKMTNGVLDEVNDQEFMMSLTVEVTSSVPHLTSSSPPARMKPLIQTARNSVMKKQGNTIYSLSNSSYVYSISYCCVSFGNWFLQLPWCYDAMLDAAM